MHDIGSRGSWREDVFVDDEDRQGLLEIVGQALRRFDAEVLAHRLLDHHYHFVLHTHQGNLFLLTLPQLQEKMGRAATAH